MTRKQLQYTIVFITALVFLLSRVAMITSMDFELKSKRVIYKQTVVQTNLAYIKSETIIQFQNKINVKLVSHDPTLIFQPSTRLYSLQAFAHRAQGSDPVLTTPFDSPAGFFSLKI